MADGRAEAGGFGRQAILLASMGLGILALAGFIAASLLDAPADGRDLAAASAPSVAAPLTPPGASATSIPETSADASPSPTARATPSPTPAPTPAGPPQAVAVGGWATVAVDELNVRREPGATSTSVYRLVQGAIARVFEGPVTHDGFDWYRIGSLGGAKGWAASGPEAEPFLTTFSEDSDLLHCGEVESDVVRIVDGSVQTVDPIRVGALALPAAAFTGMELAVLELVRANGGEACLGAQIVPVEVPVMYTQTYTAACGRVTGDGDAFRLRPIAGSRFGVDAQVKETAVVHPALLGASPNLDARIRLAAQGDGTPLCVYAGVNETATGVDIQASIDGSQCVFVEEHTADHLSIRSAAGGDTFRFAFAPDQIIEIGSITLGSAVELGISASVYGTNSSFWAWDNGAC